MTSILQKQLAVISTNSTHQLDLKARRAAHGKSLLFEPKVAVSQHFNTVYQICLEGFEELRLLDSRFSVFSGTVFSEQSKNEEREQLNQAQNNELDLVLQRFLGLVSGRLLLKPAQKAVEWLIRRFHVHEHNVEDLLLAFLPFHSTPLFLTLLSIIDPKYVPESLRFLRPYIAKSINPPLHALVHAATNSPLFFASFNRHVLRICRQHCHSSTILSFWSSVVVQAVDGMLASAQSGIESVRKQRLGAAYDQILPTVKDTLSIKDIPELAVSGCMITTILAARGGFNDMALDALMESVASSWTTASTDARLVALAVIAQERSSKKLSKLVTKKLLSLEGIVDRLATISQSYSVDRLSMGLALRILNRLTKGISETDLQVVVEVLMSGVLSESQERRVIKDLLSSLQDVASQGSQIWDENPALREKFASIITSITESSLSRLLEDVLRRNDFDVNAIEMSLQTALVRDTKMLAAEESEKEEPQGTGPTTAFEDEMALLSQLAPADQSFFTSSSELFNRLLLFYSKICTSRQALSDFLDLPVLRRKDLPSGNMSLLTFLARIWSSSAYRLQRVQALVSTSTLLKDLSKPVGDLTFLIPYILFALGDQFPQVRRAAKEVAITLTNTISLVGQSRSKPRVGKIYPDTAFKLTALPAPDVLPFLHEAVLPELDKCMLDEAVIAKVIRKFLSKQFSSMRDSISSKTRRKSLGPHNAIINFLASHAVSTPLFSVKCWLLNLLNQLGKSGSPTRAEFLYPALQSWLSLPYDTAKAQCDAQDFDITIVDQGLLHSISSKNSDRLETLSNLLSGRIGTDRFDMIKPAFRRLEEVWSTLDRDKRLDFLQILFDLTIDSSKNPAVSARHSEARILLQTLPLDGPDLIHLIDQLPNAVQLPQGPAPKRRRTSRNEMAKFELNPAETVSALGKYETVLLLVETSNPGDHPELLRVLFHVLGQLQSFAVQTDKSLVYLKSLTLNALLDIVKRAKVSKDSPADQSAIRTDLIVDTIRSSTDPQLQNTALLLVSGLASWVPDTVLHSVMPIFTFMGNNTLRQGDDYSAHVVEQTVSHVLPPMVMSLKKKSRQVVIGVSDLLISFVAAFEHIPNHRKLALFENITKTIGPEDSLFAIAVMTLDRYPTDARAHQFVADLINTFGADVGLQALNQSIDVVADLYRPRKDLAEAIIGLKDKSAANIDTIAENLLESISDLIGNDILRKRIVTLFDHQFGTAQVQQGAFSELMRTSIQLSQQVKNTHCAESANKLLSRVFQLLPTADLIQCAEILIDQASDEVRNVIIQSISGQVEGIKPSDINATDAMLHFLPRLTSLVGQTGDGSLQYNVIYCIDRISEKFGRKDTDKVLGAAEAISGPNGLGSNDPQVQIISLLALAGGVEVLKDDIVPFVPNILGRTYSLLGQTIESTKPNTGLHSASFELVNAVIQHLPFVWTDSNLDNVIRLTLSSIAKAIPDGSQSRKQFCSSLATQVDAKPLFSALERNHGWVQDTLGTHALEEFYRLSKRAVEHHPKSQVVKQAAPLFRLIIQAFGLRSVVAVSDSGLIQADEVQHLEALLLDTTMTLILKLNDATFRPFFIQLVEWVSKAGKKQTNILVPRAVTFFNFLGVLSGQLKSLVTSYMGYVLELATGLLREYLMNPSEYEAVLRPVLLALQFSFEHDQDEFWQSPSHFSAIMEPLLQLITRPADESTRILEIATITAFAAAASSGDHFKSMNTELLKSMRSDVASTRLAAVKCERSLTERLGEDWLALLPEMLPFITELLEDDEEEVERETRKWVREVEAVLGESLEGMLQ